MRRGENLCVSNGRFRARQALEACGCFFVILNTAVLLIGKTF